MVGGKVFSGKISGKTGLFQVEVRSDCIEFGWKFCEMIFFENEIYIFNVVLYILYIRDGDT